MNRFTQPTSQPQPPAPPYSDRQFLHTYAAGALLPLIQASITAAMVMVGVGVSLYMFNVLDWAKPAVISGMFAWVATWIYLQRRWINLTALEQAFRIDFNGDGQIGKPEKKETVIRLEEVKDNSHFQSHTYRLPITDDEIIMLADGLINRGRPWSRREWTPKENGFSDTEWRALQEVMFKFQLVEVFGAGYRLTRPGAAMMRYYASLSPTPVVDVVGE